MDGIKKVAVIGAGNMGGAIAAGMAGGSIIKAENIIVTAKTQATLDKIKAKIPGIGTCLDNGEAAKYADLVIVAVKPWQLEGVAEEIRSVSDCSEKIIASVVAGVDFMKLEELFGTNNSPIFRIIPNTAVSLSESTTFISSHNASTEVCDAVMNIFREMGEVFHIDEDLMAAGTSLASCGIAYAFKYIDAAMKGGMEIGFSQEEARNIVINTMEGALALLKANNSLPQEEIDKVTTPGGYTFKGLTAMEEAGFSQAVLNGLKASM